jgi:hypothetical protein
MPYRSSPSASSSSESSAAHNHYTSMDGFAPTSTISDIVVYAGRTVTTLHAARHLRTHHRSIAVV